MAPAVAKDCHGVLFPLGGRTLDELPGNRHIGDVMIYISAESSNERGDVFGRLMTDVFHTLGYDRFRLNVHQAGREVDILGEHKTERRLLVAECKAHGDPMGGADLNKFYGVLDAEKRKNVIPTSGYFVSLNGFRETAVQQERDAGGNRFILMDGLQVTEHLVSGKIMVTPEQATSAARFHAIDAIVAHRFVIAHSTGWYWLATFRSSVLPKDSFSLVHADGMVLSESRARSILSVDIMANLDLEGCSYSGPSVVDDGDKQKTARERFESYITDEYGHITLEGLPADQEVGSRRLKLERIYVPLALNPIADPDSQDGEDEEEAVISDSDSDDLSRTHRPPPVGRRQPVGSILETHPRVALLGSPGAGKTTLLKRLAVAYASRDRRMESDDDLPDRPWIPIIIRCRHLGSISDRPLLEVISDIPSRAEMPELREPFMALVLDALRSGDALLLIDGLDEIPSVSTRLGFVTQLRTFLARYPRTSLVLTSREVGYRAVAGALVDICTTFRVADLTNSDITRISVAWHREVVGTAASVEADAERLAKSIIATDRVRRLAVNPLLLTTLLLVRRWIGELPRKRSILYGKAIEVLLMTWNVEGHEPVDQDEALPQLAFAAFSMMRDGVQSVSIKQLTSYFESAREQMPDVLGYARMSVNQLMNRVEERSSLLNLSGYQEEEGQLRATYEFKHLTFQEYLSALALTEGWYPDAGPAVDLTSALDPYLDKPEWREVVPLAIVLSGRGAGAVVKRIVERLEGVSIFDEREFARPSVLAANLQQCLADEVPLAPDLVRSAASTMMRVARSSSDDQLFDSRYSSELEKVASDEVERFDDHALAYASYWAASSAHRLIQDSDRTSAMKQIITDLRAQNGLRHALTMLTAMHVVYNLAQESRVSEQKAAVPKVEFGEKSLTAAEKLFVSSVVSLAKQDLASTDERVVFAAVWTLIWSKDTRRLSAAEARSVLPSLWAAFRDAQSESMRRQLAWLIWILPIVRNYEVQLTDSDVELLVDQVETARWMRTDHRAGAIVMGFYGGRPWSPEQLVELTVATDVSDLWSSAAQTWRRRMLRAIGTPEAKEALRTIGDARTRRTTPRPRNRQ